MRAAATGSEKAYNPRAGLLHAHDYPPITFMRRYFDEYRGLRVTAALIEIGFRQCQRFSDAQSGPP